MYSISKIMIWEYFRRVRWVSLPFIAFAVMPWIGLVSNQDLQSFDPNKPEFVLFYLVFGTMGVVSIAGGLTSFQTPASRYHTLPISTPILVAWKIFLPSLLAGTLVALLYLGLNQVYSIQLPVLGISLFTAVFAALTVPVNGGGHRSSVFVIGWLLLSLVGSLWWLKARFSGPTGFPTDLWTNVTRSEFVTLFGALIATYCIEVWLVARDRCGSVLKWTIFTDWFERTQAESVSRRLALKRFFRSSAQAQFWYEYQLKGKAFPGIGWLLVSMYFIPFMIYGVWYLQFGPPLPHINNAFFIESVYGGFLSFGLLMSGMGVFAGYFIGVMNFNPTQRQTEISLNDIFDRSTLFQMGAFQASLPIPCMAYATAIFKTIIRSFLVIWLTWAILFIIYRAGLTQFYSESFKTEHAEFVDAFKALGLWYLPLTLLGPWIVSANVASIGLTGRNRITFGTYIGLPVIFFSILLGIGFVSSDWKAVVGYGCLATAAFLVCIGTVVAFIRAVRKKIITYDLTLLASVIAMSLVGLAIFLSPCELTRWAYLLIVAFAALVVLPLATIPLAIAWNRHR